MAVPRDIDAAAAEVPGVTLIDIDDLGRRVGARLDQRRQTIPAAEEIIDAELEKTVMVIGQRDTAGPTIAALVEWAEELRAREVARTFAAGEEIDEETRARVEMLTRSMVRKLLHGPVTRLREAGDPATDAGDPRGVPARPLMPAAETSTLRLATRGSALALRQATLAAECLRAAGRRSTSKPSSFAPRATAGSTPRSINSKGRVGSPPTSSAASWTDGPTSRCTARKDLPSSLAPGLTIAGYLTRADPRDGVVSASGDLLEALRAGATVGTSSARRAGLLAALYPGVRPVAIRGNVDTRLRKLDAGEVDALVLACAGLDRLSLGHRFTQRLDAAKFVPSPAQGAIALEAVTRFSCRKRVRRC